MRRYRYLFLLMVLSGMLYNSCKQEDPLLKAAREYLDSQESPGAYQDQTAIFVFDENNHQLADNQQARTCRIQNDSQSKILQMSLDKLPGPGEQCKLTVVVKGISSIENTYNVEVIRMDESKQLLWLLDQTTRTGFVMFYSF